tara:strand:- start:14 stop:460 length:447 start_codon:yes stop_codon:yes gene_type:complete
LDLIPTTGLIDEVKPTFFILCFLYWNIALPEKINLFLVLTFGLILDLAQGTVLGIYPLILLLIAYLAQKFFYQFRPFTFFQQCGVIFVFFFFIKLFLAVDFYNANQNSLSLADKDYVLLCLYYALTSSLFWPALFYFLRVYRRKWIRT